MLKSMILCGCFSLLLLSGCKTMAGWVGIASEDYVAEQIGEVRSELDAYQQDLVEIEQLINTVEDAVETTQELERLAKALEKKLQVLPRETIEQLVEILEAYLADN